MLIVVIIERALVWALDELYSPLTILGVASTLVICAGFGIWMLTINYTYVKMVEEVVTKVEEEKVRRY